MSSSTHAPHPGTRDAGKPTGRRVALRVFVYIAAVHLFAAFLFLLFFLGAHH